jgi:hypothetical protein
MDRLRAVAMDRLRAVIGRDLRFVIVNRGDPDNTRKHELDKEDPGGKHCPKAACADG